MPENWPTEEKDLEVAQNIIEEYTRGHDNPLGIFEIILSDEKEAPDVHLSEWVVTLTDYFEEKYGAELGDAVTKKVISRCMTLGKVVH